MSNLENRLITIPISHYCEKARWALEWSKIPYLEDKHLQGFHYFYTYKLAHSATVPVLKTANSTLADSTDIIKWCDSVAPEGRKLLPIDTGLRAKADQLEDYFDSELGVVGRLWMYTYLLYDIALINKYSKLHGVPAFETKLMPILFPLVKGHIRRVLKLTHTSQQDTKAIVDRIFDEVARKLNGKNFLVADTFTSADLTFAALSASVLIPENYGVCLPRLKELPEEMQDQVSVWREHPAGQYALKIYKEFRGR